MITQKTLTPLRQLGLSILAVIFFAVAVITSWRYVRYGALLWYHGARNHSFVQSTGTIYDHDRWRTNSSKTNSTRYYYTVLYVSYPYQGEILTGRVSLHDYRIERIRLFSGSIDITEKGRQIPILVYPVDPSVLLPSYDVVVMDYWLRLIG